MLSKFEVKNVARKISRAKGGITFIYLFLVTLCSLRIALQLDDETTETPLATVVAVWLHPTNQHHNIMIIIIAIAPSH
jgi:hypothetical protein